MAETQVTNGQQENQSQKRSQESQAARTSQSAASRRMQDPVAFLPRDLFSGSPFSMMRRMSEEMDRMFADFGFARSLGEGKGWAPAIEVAERESNYIVHAELPGLKPEEVKVDVTDDAIIIQGERKSMRDENKGGIHRSERRYGQFYRSIPLPEGANTDQIKANFDNGVLEVTVPMPPPPQVNRRQIPIQGGRSGGGSKPNA